MNLGSPWPDPLPTEALHGLAGDVVRTMEPHSESDPAALLLQTLAAFGNLVGREPHFMAESDWHGTNLFVVLVGATSKGRKGSSWSRVKTLVEAVDPEWIKARLLGGLFFWRRLNKRA